MWHITKAPALVAIRQFSSAEIAIGVVLQHSAADAEALLTLAELNEAIGNDAAAIEAYEGALRNATGGDEIHVRYSFGGFAASRQNFSRAVELWKPLIDPANLTEAALDRNIEIGVLIRDRAVALTITGYFRNLIDRDWLKPLPQT